MCHHHYSATYHQPLPTTCALQTWFDAADTSAFEYPDLPHDGKGLCIFHSPDRKWKNANHCGERFTELFHAMAADEKLADLDFREVILTGMDMDAEAENLGQRARKTEKCILIGGVQTAKPIRFKGARFLDHLRMGQLETEENIDFDESVFKSFVDIERCQFKGPVSFLACRFEQNVMLEDCHFGEIANFNEAVFMEQICMTQVRFVDGAVFDKANQLANDTICQFIEVSFEAYSSFSNGGFNSSVTFDACRFGAETHFENTVFRQRLQLIDPLVEEKVFFLGTRPGVKLFENAVDIELNDESFSPVGQIIFQNANLFNLNPAFKETLRALEINHRVEIREGCLLYRTSIERLFDYKQLDQFLLEDLARVFARFFETRHLRSLKVDVFRDLAAGKIRVVFHTDEAMSIPEFETLLCRTQKEMLGFMAAPADYRTSPAPAEVMEDHLLQLKSIWQRLVAAQALPLLGRFFEHPDPAEMEQIRQLLNVTLHVHVKNAVINSQIEAGGHVRLGDDLVAGP